MTSIDIIECSRSNAVAGTNSNWTNTYASPIEIQTNDVIQVKNCFVDTNTTNSSNIQLSQDVNIELKLGYYIINNHQPTASDYKTFHGGAGVDYQPYIARKENFEPHLNTFKYTLPKGSYTASDIAQTLTRQFTRVEFKTPIPTSLNGVKSGNVFLINTRDINDTNIDMRFYEQKTTRDEYNAGTNAKYFTFNRTHDIGGEVPRTTKPCWNIGASQVALIWNKNLDGRFQFQFLHTPIISEGHVAVAIHRNYANTHYYMYNRRTGMFFTEMKPTNFWESLGFNVSAGDPASMIVSFDEEHKVDTDLDVAQGIKTTGGFIGLTNMMENPGKSKINSLDSNWASLNPGTLTEYTYTEDTYNIISSRNYDPQQDGGYWLLSVSNFHNEFHEDSQERHDIQALIPRNYIQNNYITAYQESGISWVNRGEPFLLSSVNIQILEPKTKAAVSESNLGENNAVFLQVIHSPQK